MVFFGLHLFLVSSYKKKKKKKKCDVCCPHCSVSFLWPVPVQPGHQGAPSQRIISLNKASPPPWLRFSAPLTLGTGHEAEGASSRKTWNRPQQPPPTLTPPTPPPHPNPRCLSLLCLSVSGRRSSSRACSALKNALVFPLENINGSLGWKMTVK